jgi:hypothetical protein
MAPINLRRPAIDNDNFTEEGRENGARLVLAWPKLVSSSEHAVGQQASSGMCLELERMRCLRLR